MAFLQLDEANGETLLAGRDGAQLYLQALLLHRQRLLLMGGVNERQLHLITTVMELLLARLEITLPRCPAGDLLTGQIPDRLEDA